MRLVVSLGLVTLTRCDRFLRRGGAFLGWACGRGFTAPCAATMRRCSIFGVAATRAALFAATRLLVDSGPSAALRLIILDTALLVTLLDMFCLVPLLLGVG